MTDMVDKSFNPEMPHGQRFRLIHRVTGITEDKVITGEFDYGGDEVYLARDHFPDDPVQPGILVQEGIAQTLVNLARIYPEFEGYNFYFAECKTKWRGAVRPPSKIVYSGKITRIRKGVGGWAEGTATVDGKIVCEVKLSFRIFKPAVSNG